MTRTRTALSALATVTGAAALWTASTIGAQESKRPHAIEGDPSKSGPFTLRIKLPDGYRIPPHWHPADEHVTVVQGTFVLGIGEKFEQTGGHELGAGAFALMPSGTRHYASAKGETVVQLHGVGPWGINYVNAADDPRKKPGME
jgi:quercetin dioxygenase-like cupin family protein